MSETIKLLSAKTLSRVTGISVPYIYKLERDGIIESLMDDQHIYEEGTVAIVREFMDRPRSGRKRNELGMFEAEIEY